MPSGPQNQSGSCQEKNLALPGIEKKVWKEAFVAYARYLLRGGRNEENYKRAQ
jgi:hypothetical protein